MPPTGIPAAIWMLGITSLCMDVSSELIHSLLPVFLITVLGGNALWLGVIEGVAECAALLAKVSSGVLSDRLARRKPVVVAGYGLAALSKLAFPLATGAAWIAGARLVDRLGKGIRAAPRDALVADLTPSEQRGAAYGLRLALDSVGAIGGPLLAIALMIAFAGDIRAVFWVAVVPALLAVAVLLLGVREPARMGAMPARISMAPLRRLGAGWYAVAALGALLTAARFSQGFLLLRGQQAGLAVTWSPLVMVTLNAVLAACAWPAGTLADRGRRRALLLAGMSALVAADLLLVHGSLIAVLAGAALWGLHLGLTEGLMAKWVAEASPEELRATAFGWFHLLCGAAALFSNILAGWLWERAGAAAPFAMGASLAALVLAGLLWRTARPAGGG